MPSAIRLSEAIDLFLEVLKAQNMSPSTIKTRRSTLLRFLAVVGNIYPRNLNARHVDDYILAHPEWQPSTRKVNLEHLSAFQKWLQARKLLDRSEDILEGRRRIKVPKKRQVRIPERDFEPLLDSAKTGRDRIILALGLYLMVRVSEMLTIRWGHVDLEEGYVNIYRTKTGEPDRLPISAELDAELRLWRQDALFQTGFSELHPHWFVVCSMRPIAGRDELGKYLSLTELMPERALRNPGVRIKKVLASFGIEGQSVNMHTLRRSGAVALEAAMIRLAAERPEMAIDPIGIVQEMLGHANRVTTEIYLDRHANRARRDVLIKGQVLYFSGREDGVRV